MALYDLVVKPLARKMDLDAASKVALQYFRFTGLVPGGRTLRRLIYKNRPVGLEREVFGLKFYNPVGLGAGLDIHGDLYNDLNNLGFSFSQIGPMGLEGVKNAVRTLQKDPQNDILAVCINEDFLTSFTIAYDFCDFFVIDLSETNGPEVADSIIDARLTEDIYKPIVIKISPEVGEARMGGIINYCMMNGIDGIEVSELSQIKLINRLTAGRLPVIADNPINTPQDAAEALEAGASLLEVRRGLIKEGPKFVSRILNYLLKAQKNERTSSKQNRQLPKKEQVDS